MNLLLRLAKWIATRNRVEDNTMDEDYLLEQYKIVSSSFNDEITRFWTRFNILVGIDIGGLIGVLASLKVLILNPGLFRIVLIAMTFFSLATAAIVWRGFLMHQTLLRVVAEFEKRSEGKLNILQISGQGSRVPVGVNQIIAIAITLALAVVWISLLIYAEYIGYAFVSPV